MGGSIVTGTCRLCLAEDVRLLDSHLMPKWTYKRLLNRRMRNPHPVIYTATNALKTSAQAREHLLCATCEARFSGPERSASNLAYYQDRPAALATMVRTQGTTVAVNGSPVVAAQLDDPDVRQLGYYAISILWRASISRVAARPVRLGPYQEKIRAYLNDEAPLPNGVGVLTYVIAEDEDISLRLAATEPTTDPILGCHRHRFATAGLYFDVYVGQRQPKIMKVACTARVQAPLVGIARAADTNLTTQIRMLMAAGTEAKARRAVTTAST